MKNRRVKPLPRLQRRLFNNSQVFVLEHTEIFNNRINYIQRNAIKRLPLKITLAVEHKNIVTQYWIIFYENQGVFFYTNGQLLNPQE